MNKSKFTITIIGAGYMAEEHIKVFSSMQEFKIIGIYSRTISKAKLLANKFNIPVVVENISDIYEKTKSDLLLIAVSEMSVYSIVSEVFKYPWLCLIEKPAGYNFEDAVKINELAEKYQSRVFVSLNRRFFHSTQLVLSELNKNEGRRLIQVHDQEEPFNRPPEVMKNWMYANSVHVIDYLTILGRGKIIQVSPIIHWIPENPNYVVAKIEYSSGDIAIYTAVWNAPGPWAVSVTTKAKRWELKPLEFAFVQLSGSRKLESFSTHQWDIDFKPGLRMQADELLKALKGDTSKLVSLDESLETMDLVKKIYEV